MGWVSKGAVILGVHGDMIGVWGGLTKGAVSVGSGCG